MLCAAVVFVQHCSHCKRWDKLLRQSAAGLLVRLRAANELRRAITLGADLGAALSGFGLARMARTGILCKPVINAASRPESAGL